jgi:hypothetical protein
VGLTTLPCKKKIVEKPPSNSAGFCGGGQGLSWAVEPRKEERFIIYNMLYYNYVIHHRSKIPNPSFILRCIRLNAL